MVSTSDVDQMHVAGLVLNVLMVVGLGAGAVSFSRQRQRIVSALSVVPHFAFFIAYVFLKLDAGFKGRDDGVAFPTPFWVAMFVYSLIAATINNLNMELSKAYGIFQIVLMGASSFTLLLSGREDQRQPRRAMYAMSWLPFAGGFIVSVVASRARRLKNVDANGQVLQDNLIMTPSEKFMMYARGVLTYGILFTAALGLGLGPEGWHNISVGSRFVAYFVANLLMIVGSIFNVMTVRDHSVPPKQD